MPNATVQANAQAMPIDRRAALGALAAGAASAAGAPLAAIAAALPAAATPNLVAEFEAAWAEERAVDVSYAEDDPRWQPTYEAASDRTRAVVERIIAVPTKDLEGLKLKARAFRWCYANDTEEGLAVLSEKADTTDLKVMHSIMRDLLALSGEA